MRRFLKFAGVAVVVMLVLIVVVIVGNELTSLTEPRRQPLQIEIQETESPFNVRDMQDETRDRINNRLND